MLEAILMDKLIGMAKWFNFIGWVISAVIFIWTLARGLRNTGYGEEEWSIDYYNIAQREDRFTNLTILFCIIQTLSTSHFPASLHCLQCFQLRIGQ